jgi:hypothetical protein
LLVERKQLKPADFIQTGYFLKIGGFDTAPAVGAGVRASPYSTTG